MDLPYLDSVRKVQRDRLALLLMLDLAFEDFNIDCALCFTEVRLKDFIHSNLRIVCVFARGIVEHCPVSFNLGLINWVHITEELEHVLAIEWFS